jgi:hypothetical protein
VPAVALLVLTACKGPPARIVASASDTIVVNSPDAAKLTVQVFDVSGAELPSRDVRYRWLSGDPVRLSAEGRVTCARRGDSEVRATIGTISTRIFLLCRPLRAVDVSLAGDLVVGGPPQQLLFNALGMDSQPVTLVAGSATIRDSSIVSLRGLQVFPKQPGETTVDMELGNCVQTMNVTVDEQVDSAGRLQPYQQFVVSPLRLVPGEIRSWQLTPGVYDITLREDTSSHAELLLGAIATSCITDRTFHVEGTRGPQDDVQHYSLCIARKGASVVVRHPRRIGHGEPISAQLVVRRVPDPWSGAGRKVQQPALATESGKPQCARAMFTGIGGRSRLTAPSAGRR